MDIVLARNLVEATQDTGSFIMYSSALKRLAVKLSKISNDLRLMSSGPRTGFGEINLPPMQPGSSIMPGKINPVIPAIKLPIDNERMAFPMSSDFFTNRIISNNEIHFDMKVTMVIKRIFGTP